MPETQHRPPPSVLISPPSRQPRTAKHFSLKAPGRRLPASYISRAPKALPRPGPRHSSPKAPSTLPQGSRQALFPKGQNSPLAQRIASKGPRPSPSNPPWALCRIGRDPSPNRARPASPLWVRTPTRPGMSPPPAGDRPAARPPGLGRGGRNLAQRAPGAHLGEVPEARPG
jgi:hypothetical protein